MNKVLIIVFLSLLGLIMGLRHVRTLNTENVALQIEYLGTCQDFINKDLASVRISSHSPGACLPLLSGGVSIPFKGEFNDPDLFYSDINDLESDYFCTDMDGPKALIHFVDVYNKQKQIVSDYILSFVPSSPFRARSSDIVYTRRPSCETDKLFCPPYTETVTNCTPNVIQFGAILEKGKNFLENAYVITRDRIYLSTSKNVPSLCDDGVSCCTYIASKQNGGMCPYQTGDFVLPFLEDYELHSTVSNEHKELLKQNPHIKQVFKHKKVSHNAHYNKPQNKPQNKPLKVQHKQTEQVDSDDSIGSLSFNRHTPSNKKSQHAPDSKNGKQMYHHGPKSN